MDACLIHEAHLGSQERGCEFDLGSGEAPVVHLYGTDQLRLAGLGVRQGFGGGVPSVRHGRCGRRAGRPPGRKRGLALNAECQWNSGDVLRIIEMDVVNRDLSPLGGCSVA